MNEFDKAKVMKMSCILILIFLIVGTASYFHKKNSITLADYAKSHPSEATASETEGSGTGDITAEKNPPGSDFSGSDTSVGDTSDSDTSDSGLIGAMLNNGTSGQDMLSSRVTYKNSYGIPAEAFYYEKLSDNLLLYITGISFPAKDLAQTDISAEDLRYVHILHYDFDGNPAEGELICNISIADDLLSIFHELYLNEYQIQQVHLIDEFGGDDEASMEANNTSCFNYRVVEGSSSLSKHAYGLAIDINPLYNPYITYDGQGGISVSPANAVSYTDRFAEFPYKIDKQDLCYQLFMEHGFTWGGNWNSVKDYQHFQKTK